MKTFFAILLLSFSAFSAEPTPDEIRNEVLKHQKQINICHKQARAEDNGQIRVNVQFILMKDTGHVKMIAIKDVPTANLRNCLIGIFRQLNFTGYDFPNEIKVNQPVILYRAN